MSKLTLNTEIQNEWEKLMQDGYHYSLTGNSVEAARLWRELWNRMHVVLKADDNISSGLKHKKCCGK
ncbi:hypothetical protein L1N85_13680 [Paenibacillus alkaliterrae]|uniref:hypothetical protein n=1 Tax=Paenibacillus alkaliterrae TaxID=320909 RepID=UPI001F28ED5D|nr:hypothetical protein [Paenibacillus alkaliterrae]MCF2939470.1 hypothetical protein [Paenibacillus alkaliterrae]